MVNLREIYAFSASGAIRRQLQRNVLQARQNVFSGRRAGSSSIVFREQGLTAEQAAAIEHQRQLNEIQASFSSIPTAKSVIVEKKDLAAPVSPEQTPASFEPSLSPELRSLQQLNQNISFGGIVGFQYQLFASKKAKFIEEARRALEQQNLVIARASELSDEVVQIEAEREELQRVINAGVAPPSAIRNRVNDFEKKVDEFNRRQEDVSLQAEQVTSKIAELYLKEKVINQIEQKIGERLTRQLGRPGAVIAAAPEKKAFGPGEFNLSEEVSRGFEGGKQETITAAKFLFERSGLAKSPIAGPVREGGKAVLPVLGVLGGAVGVVGSVPVVFIGKTAENVLPEFNFSVPIAQQGGEIILGAQKVPFVRGFLSPLSVQVSPKTGYSLNIGKPEVAEFLGLAGTFAATKIIFKGVKAVVKGKLVERDVFVSPGRIKVGIVEARESGGLFKAKAKGFIAIEEVRKNILNRGSISKKIVGFSSRFRFGVEKLTGKELEPFTVRAAEKVVSADVQQIVEVTGKEAGAIAKNLSEPRIIKSVGQIKLSRVPALKIGKKPVIFKSEKVPFGETTVSLTQRSEFLKLSYKQLDRVLKSESGVFGRVVGQKKLKSVVEAPGEFAIKSDVRTIPRSEGTRIKGSFEIDSKTFFEKQKETVKTNIFVRGKGQLRGFLKSEKLVIKLEKPPKVSAARALENLQAFFEKQRLEQISNEFSAVISERLSVIGEKAASKVSEPKAIESFAESVSGESVSFAGLSSKGLKFETEEVFNVQNFAEFSSFYEKFLSERKPVLIEKGLDKNLNLNKTSEALRLQPSLGQREFQSALENLQERTGPVLESRSIQKSAEAERVKLAELLRLRTLQSEALLDFNLNVPVEIPKLEPPGIPGHDLSDFEFFDLLLSESGSRAFDVLVRKKRKLVKLGKKPLPENKALNAGAEFVDNRPAASFKIRDSGKKTKVRDDLFFNKAFKFRRGKRDKDLFVELEAYRIDSPGEVKGITAKGIEARKKKGFLSNFLGGKFDEFFKF